MTKHMFRVVPCAANPPHNRVFFQCDHCPANINIERPVMEALITKRDDRLVGVGFGSFSKCPWNSRLDYTNY